MSERQKPSEEGQALSGEDLARRSGPRLEEAQGWHRPHVGPLHTKAAAVPRAPRELRELEGYLFLALALVGTSLALSLVEETIQQGYLLALRAVLSFAVLIVCTTALTRLRKARKGLVRTGLPSTRDAVTGLPDEQFFWLRLREECARARRYNESFSVAVVDVNSLAMINHAYGQAAGDATLNRVARVVEAAKRGSDVAVRMTDDEFALLLLDCEKEGASAFARRVQQYLNGQPAVFVLDGRSLTLPVGVSIGIASVADRETGAEELVARARHNLAAAKEERDLERSRWAI